MDARRTPDGPQWSTPRVALVFALLAGAIAIAGWAVMDAGDPPPVSAIRQRPADDTTGHDATAGALPSPTDATAPAGPVATRVDAAAEDRATRRAAGPRTTTATPGETIVLRRGRVVLTDLDGREQHAARGTLDVFYWRGSYGEAEDGVEVVDGQFTLQAPSLAKSVDFLRGELDGAPAWLDALDVSLEQGGDLLIRAQMKRVTRLLVVADESGEPLKNVTVLDEARAEQTELEAQEEEERRHGLSFSARHRSTPIRRPWARDLDPESAIELRHRPSPIVLPEPESAPAEPLQTLLVMAPDRATQPCEVDFSTGGDTTVRMVLGGELIVVCPPLPFPNRRVARPEEDWERADGSEIFFSPSLVVDGPAGRRTRTLEFDRSVPTEFRFTALPPEPHLVTLDCSLPDADASSEQAVSVKSGATVRVEFTQPPPPRKRSVPVSGVLVLPPGCLEESVQLRFHLEAAADGDTRNEHDGLDGVSTHATRDGIQIVSGGIIFRDADDVTLSLRPGARRGRTVLPFDTGGMQRGRWRVTCDSPPISVEFDTGLHGRSDLRLVGRSLVAVEVVLIDAATGAPCSVAGSVSWCSVPDDAERAFGPFRGTTLDDAGTARFTLPAGRTHVVLSGPLGVGYELPDPTVVAVSPEQPRIELKLRRRPSLTLYVRLRGESDAPEFTGRGAMPPSHAVAGALRLRCLDAPDLEAPPWDADLHAVRFGLPRAGRWRVEFGAIDGFARLDAQDLLIGPDEWAEHTIELVRR